LNEYLIRNSKEIIYQKNKKVLTKTPLKMKTNLTMKKISLFLLGLLAVVFITSCNKTEETTPQQGTTELSFTIQPGKSTSGLKASECFDQKASYVNVTIDGQLHKIDVFYIDNVPYTNTIKLAAGSHIIEEFIMYNDNMTPAVSGDDYVMAAAVHTGADYSDLVTNLLDKNVTIEPFKKNVLAIDLVCYEAAYFENFGFEYFHLDQTIIREQNFFGDFCIKNVADYAGSPYALQENGVQLDMPALFKIELWQNDLLIQTYSNAAWHGEGQPLKVTYADNLNQVDNYILKLFILVRQGTAFSYVHFHDWTFADAQTIDAGTDGVVDFALGNCVPDADLVIPPWMNLPPTATYRITGFPGTNCYVNATLSNIPSGYEFGNGAVESWCADHATTINTNTNYTMDVYSSLYPELLPEYAQSDKWAKANWLMNHLDWFPGYHWYDIQGAMWLCDAPAWDGAAGNGMPALTPMMTTMKQKMDAYGLTYHVPSGGWATIIFVPTGTSPNAPSPTIQTMFIKVDP
jgi:hypothetical protein